MTTSSGGGQERASSRTQETEDVEVEASAETQDRVGKLTDDVDSLLDDIDEALEANAEDFVKGYVQKGGQ